MIRRTIKKRPVHAERHQDVLRDVHLVVVAGQELDDASEKDHAWIRVAVLRPRFERHVRVRHHRDDLLPRRRLEGMPGPVAAPGPGGRAEAGAVRHQVTDLHLRDVAERVVGQTQLRHVLHDGIVERQPATIAELHDRDAGEGLRDRGPVVNRLGVDRPFRVEILIALDVARDDPAVAHDHQRAAGDARLVQQVAVAGDDLRPLARLLHWDEKGDEQQRENVDPHRRRRRVAARSRRTSAASRDRQAVDRGTGEAHPR